MIAHRPGFPVGESLRKSVCKEKPSASSNSPFQAGTPWFFLQHHQRKGETNWMDQPDASLLRCLAVVCCCPCPVSAPVVAVENDDDDDGLLSYPSLLAFILSPDEQLPNDTPNSSWLLFLVFALNVVGQVIMHHRVVCISVTVCVHARQTTEQGPRLYLGDY